MRTSGINLVAAVVMGYWLGGIAGGAEPNIIWLTPEERGVPEEPIPVASPGLAAPAPSVEPSPPRKGGHAGKLGSILACPTPDGRQVATYSMTARELRIWDAANLCSLLFATDLRITAIAFAPDNRSFVTLELANQDALKHWSWPEGKLLKTYDVAGNHVKDAGAYFVLDHRHVAINGGRRAAVLNLETGKSVQLEFGETADLVIPARIAELEQQLAALEGEELRIIQETTGMDEPELMALKANAAQGGLDSEAAADWERKMALAKERIRFEINPRRGKLTTQIGQLRLKAALPANPMIAPVLAGKAVAVLDNPHDEIRSVRIHEAVTGKAIRACERNHPREVSQERQTHAYLLSTPSGSHLIEARQFTSGNDCEQAVTVWDAATGKEVAHRRWGQGDGLGFIAGRGGIVAQGDSKTLLLSGEGAICAWNWGESGEPQYGKPAPEADLKLFPLSQDGTRCVAIGREAAWIYHPGEQRFDPWHLGDEIGLR